MTNDIRDAEGQIPHTVLVVDDNPATRYSTGRLLRAAGFHTEEAASGEDALIWARKGVAAIVLDVHLPDIDGFEVCRRLREGEDTARIPVIHLSAAYVADLDKVKGLYSGADAYMTHPVEPALLVATVQALVRARVAEEGMRRSQARFRAIYDAAPTGICLIDSDGRLVDVNPAMLALLKRPSSAVVGHELSEFVPVTFRHAADAMRAASMQAHGPAMWRGDFPLFTADGSLVHLEWKLSTHIEPGLSMATAVDITERSAIARQREDLLMREQVARAAAERMSRSKDDFIAILSHELRTPLNTILGWVHILRLAPTEDNLKRGIDAIERSSHTQTRLISDILDVSRMNLGKLTLDAQPINVPELVQSAVGALRSALNDKSLKLELNLAETAKPLVADPARFQQIVWNLLTNAIKFSHTGGVIRLRTLQDDRQFTLEVIDEGEGISADFIPYLFDPYTQSDTTSRRSHTGLGLGLAIVKQLSELHGGEVTATSGGRDKGARFIVRLPAAGGSVRADSPIDAVGDTSVKKTPANLRGLRVLIVEDDSDAREVLRFALTERGVEVVATDGYVSCMNALRTFHPDVLISDIGMPGRDGYELIQDVRLAEESAGRRLPAVALSAFARAEDRQKAVAAGFDAHCAKPVNLPELLDTLERLAAAQIPAAS